MPPGVPRGEQVELGVQESQVAPAQPGTQGDGGAQRSWRPQRLPLRCRAPPSVCARGDCPRQGGTARKDWRELAQSPREPRRGCLRGLECGVVLRVVAAAGHGGGVSPAPQGGDASLVCQSSELDQKGSPGHRAKLQDIFRSTRIPAAHPPQKNFNV